MPETDDYDDHGLRLHHDLHVRQRCKVCMRSASSLRSLTSHGDWARVARADSAELREKGHFQKDAKVRDFSGSVAPTAVPEVRLAENIGFVQREALGQDNLGLEAILERICEDFNLSGTQKGTFFCCYALRFRCFVR